MNEAKRNECTSPPPCWAVFITKAWGEKIEERQQSIPLTKQEAKTHIDVLRLMHHGWGHRYRMRKLTNAQISVGTPSAESDCYAGDCTACGGPVFHRDGKPGEYDHECRKHNVKAETSERSKV